MGRDETSVPGCDQSRFIQKQRDTLSAVIRALSAFRPPRIWELGAVGTGTLTFVKTEDESGKEGKMKKKTLL